MRKALSALLLCVAGMFVVGAFNTSVGGAKAVGGDGTKAFDQRPDYDRPEDVGFDVQVLVEGRPLEEYAARGRRYVEALRGSEYELRIRNPLPVRVAVALSVDGLNTIDARRTTRWDASKWVIEPYQTITIGGWQMSTERARRFYFTTERDSYAAKLGRPSDLGMISAAFFRERRRTPAVVTPPYPTREPRGQMENQSREERSAPSARGADSAGKRSNRSVAPVPDDDYAATGIGRSVHNDVRWVHLDLDPRPVAEVMIRYEYREALVRLGVLPRPRPDADALRRRERAKGFEDSRFCPEP